MSSIAESIETYLLTNRSSNGIVNSDTSISTRPNCNVDELWSYLFYSIENEDEVKLPEGVEEDFKQVTANETSGTEAISFVFLHTKEAYEELNLQEDCTVEEIEDIAPGIYIQVVKDMEVGIFKSRKTGALLSLASKFQSTSAILKEFGYRIIAMEGSMQVNISRNNEPDSFEHEDFSALILEFTKFEKKRNYKIFPLTFNNINLEKSMKFLQLESGCSDADIIKKCCSLSKAGAYFDRKTAGCIITLCMNRENYQVFSPFINEILGIECRSYISSLHLPHIQHVDVVRTKRLSRLIPTSRLFGYSIITSELAFDILNCEKDASSQDVVHHFQSYKEPNGHGREYFIAALMKIASIPNNKEKESYSKLFEALIGGRVEVYILNLEIDTEVKSYLIKEFRYRFDHDDTSLQTQLARKEKELEVSKSVITELRKKSNSSLPSKFALAQVQLDQFRKKEEVQLQEKVKLEEELKLAEKREVQLILELKKEKEENFLLVKENNKLVKLNSVKANSTSSSVGESTSSSVSSLPGDLNSKSLIQKLLAQLNLANEELSLKTTENTELLMKLSGLY